MHGSEQCHQGTLEARSTGVHLACSSRPATVGLSESIREDATAAAPGKSALALFQASARRRDEEADPHAPCPCRSTPPRDQEEDHGDAEPPHGTRAARSCRLQHRRCRRRTRRERARAAPSPPPSAPPAAPTQQPRPLPPPPTPASRRTCAQSLKPCTTCRSSQRRRIVAEDSAVQRERSAPTLQPRRQPTAAAPRQAHAATSSRTTRAERADAFSLAGVK